MGRARRRARRRAARRRPARLLPAPPRVGASLPPAPAERARGAHPLRQVAHRQRRVGATVLGAHLRDHRRPRRRIGEPRGRPLAAACRPIARCGGPRPTRSPSRSRPGCARARSCSTRCSSTSRSTTGCAATRAGSRAATSATRRATSRCEALVDRGAGALRHPAALVRAQGAAARRRADRRLRPHGVGGVAPTRSSAGARRATWCSTPTRRSRPISLRPRSASSTKSWIDAPMRPGKRPGAFCAYTVPSQHPYLLLNWTSRRRDVLTLAHEMGHGLHAYLARDQGIFHQTTPLTLAETASVFGETVTFGRLLDATDDPRATPGAARRERSRGRSRPCSARWR